MKKDVGELLEGFYPDAEKLQSNVEKIITLIAEDKLTYSEAKQVLEMAKEYLSKMVVIGLKD